MKLMALVFSLFLCACGTDEYPEEKPMDGCGPGWSGGKGIDPYFAEYIETVRTKIEEHGRTDLDLQKIDWIRNFQFIDFQGTQSGKDVYGVNRKVKPKSCEHEVYDIDVSRMETLPAKIAYKGAVDLIIYHEIMHIWFDHKAWGIMAAAGVGPNWTTEKVLEGIDNLLEGKDEGTLPGFLTDERTGDDETESTVGLSEME